MRSSVAGRAGSVRVMRLSPQAFAAAEAHGKRLDRSSQARAINDKAPLTSWGLDLEKLYRKHAEGAFVPKSQTKALHVLIQFPTDLVEGEDPVGMILEAHKFAREVWGNEAIFADRVDRDEKGRHIVDLFLAPRYAKKTKHTTKPAISTSKHLQDLAVKLGRWDGSAKTKAPLRMQGQALQDAWYDHLKNRMRLSRVERGSPKKTPGDDWLSAEELELARREHEVEARAENLAKEQVRFEEQTTAFKNEQNALSNEQADLEAKKAEVALREEAAQRLQVAAEKMNSDAEATRKAAEEASRSASEREKSADECFENASSILKLAGNLKILSENDAAEREERLLISEQEAVKREEERREALEQDRNLLRTAQEKLSAKEESVIEREKAATARLEEVNLIHDGAIEIYQGRILPYDLDEDVHNDAEEHRPAKPVKLIDKIRAKSAVRETLSKVAERVHRVLEIGLSQAESKLKADYEKKRNALQIITEKYEKALSLASKRTAELERLLKRITPAVESAIRREDLELSRDIEAASARVEAHPAPTLPNLTPEEMAFLQAQQREASR